MKKRFTEIKITFAVMAIIGASNVIAAGDSDKGKTLSVTCAACHGMNGISQIPMYPNLAGQKEVYLDKQLKAFRDGSRKDPVMAPMAASLSDDDIANLAAYFASLNPAG